MSVPTSPISSRRHVTQGTEEDGENSSSGTGTGSWLEAISGVMGELLQSWGIIGALKRRGWGTGGRSTSNTPPPFNQASNNYEHIELSPLNIQNPCYLRIEGALPGQGHDFKATTLERPAWCDACAHLVFYHATTCNNCNLMCHEQCQGVVSLDCKMDSPDGDLQFHDANSQVEDISNSDFFPLEDNENQGLIKETSEHRESFDSEENLGGEENVSEGEEEKHEEEMLEKEIKSDSDMSSLKKQEVSTLRRTVRRIQSRTVDSAKIEEWVQKCPANNVGLQITKEDDGGYRGCLRIHLNLSRPINIVTGTRPPSIYDILQEERTLEKTLTSFYMPRDIVKAIHITSKTTTNEVIVALLRKFKVVDNPQKFALYERTYDTGQSMKAILRRLADNECPLVLAIAWNAQDITNKRLVLQENDTADIQWEAFSLPELDNFLRILDREEKEYKNQIRDKYSLLRQRIQFQLFRLTPNNV